MIQKGSISPEARQALAFALVSQVVVGVFLGLLLDGGQMLVFWVVSMIAFWGGVLARLVRGGVLTRVDRALIRGGIFLVFPITVVVMVAVWHWRGVL